MAEPKDRFENVGPDKIKEIMGLDSVSLMRRLATDLVVKEEGEDVLNMEDKINKRCEELCFFVSGDDSRRRGLRIRGWKALVLNLECGMKIEEKERIKYERVPGMAGFFSDEEA